MALSFGARVGQSLSFKDCLQQGFTLLELLVVVAVLTILGSLLLASLSAAKQRSQAVKCLSNGRQLLYALSMYATDAHDWLPPNPDYQSSEMWVAGDMGHPDEATNLLLLANPKTCKLALYTSPRTFKCPGDKTPQVRTFSMSQAVGTKPTLPIAAVDGPWLDGTHEHKSGHPWLTYGRFVDIVAPAPSRLWVLVDENQYTINDAAFAVSMTSPTEMVDWPGSSHNSAGTVHFADGHSEIHKWRDGRTLIRHRVPQRPHQLPGNSDILWLQERTSAKGS